MKLPKGRITNSLRSRTAFFEIKIKQFDFYAAIPLRSKHGVQALYNYTRHFPRPFPTTFLEKTLFLALCNLRGDVQPSLQRFIGSPVQDRAGGSSGLPADLLWSLERVFQKG